MLKTLIKTGTAAALGWTGADRAIASWMGSKTLPLVLGYHAVVEDYTAHIGRAILPSLISLDMLECHLDWIGRRYQFIGLDELGAQMERGEPFTYPTAAVTFDDGYAGVYHHAFPLLKRKGIPAGMFIVTEATGCPELQLYDKMYLLLEKVLPVIDHSEARLRHMLDARNVRLGDRNGGGRLDGAFNTMRWLFSTLTQNKFRCAIEALETVCRIDNGDYPDMQLLDWEMVQTMADSGMTIGSHTQTHVLLTEESAEQAAEQTAGSMLTLKHKLKRPIAHFAYPDGRFNPAVVSAVAEAGYRFGYGTCLRRDPGYPFLTIPRTLLSEQTCAGAAGEFAPALLNCHALRLYDLWSPCPHDHIGSIAAPASEVGPLAGGSALTASRQQREAPDRQHA